MATGSENYLALVKQAYAGDLKLPAFQRDFKWNRKQVIRLYDSIRQSYPLGAIILLEGTKTEFQERAFRGASGAAKEKPTKRLVLDGQQRLTAGIDLFHGGSLETGASYFIDLNKLSDLIKERAVDVDNDQSVRHFLAELEDDDGYCVAKMPVENPNHALVTKHLLSTTLLRPDNSKDRDHYLEEYEEKFPDRKRLVRNVVKPFLVVNGAPDIPFVAIDSSLQLDAISRIFSTLNSSGKVLSPFDLVVAVMFAGHIDLRKDLADLRESNPFLENMDSTGEIVLQTAAMLAGKNQKKALLPKTLKPDDWKTHRERANELLGQVGFFLTEQLGMALDKTASLVPYDSIFAPMAKVFSDVGYSSLPSGNRGVANMKLKQWVIGSALSQRYQEGVHNKQANDAKDFAAWIKTGSDVSRPDWLEDVYVPPLRKVTTKGAISNLLRCLMNDNHLKDPVTGEAVSFGTAGAHAHHIFPKKFVGKIPGWDEKVGDSADVFLNLMQLTASTNSSFLNDDPRQQVLAAEQKTSAAFIDQIYSNQGIPSDALAILRKAEKSKDDYSNFLKIRETVFEKKLAALGFSKGGGEISDDDLEAA
jgi:hypothetical protein